MVKIKTILRKILYWLFFAFLIYVAYELLRKILGYSLDFEELVTILLVANIGYSFYHSHTLIKIKDSVNKIDKKLSGHIGWHKGKNEK